MLYICFAEARYRTHHLMMNIKCNVNIKGSLPDLHADVGEAVTCVILALFASHMLTVIFPTEAATPLFIFIFMLKTQPA